MLCTKHYTRLNRHGDPKVNKNHGFKKNKSPAYTCWSHIKSRCYNEKDQDYHYYGGRGIIVCDRWKNDFVSFYEDMGDRPSPKHSIDRIDTNGNYEPGNCRWATAYTQVKNRRLQKSNTSGVEGVNPHKDGGYVARITIHGERHYLGYFKTRDEAVAARVLAERKFNAIQAT
jgi:hypothetical protein